MHYIFDGAGTLADTYHLLVESFDEAAQRFGFLSLQHAQEDKVRALEASQILAFHGVRPDQVNEVVKALRMGTEARADRSPLFPGVARRSRNSDAPGTRSPLPRPTPGRWLRRRSARS